MNVGKGTENRNLIFSTGCGKIKCVSDAALFYKYGIGISNSNTT
jgi:hypothetical protein